MAPVADLRRMPVAAVRESAELPENKQERLQRPLILQRSASLAAVVQRWSRIPSVMAEEAVAAERCWVQPAPAAWAARTRRKISLYRDSDSRNLGKT